MIIVPVNETVEKALKKYKKKFEKIGLVKEFKKRMQFQKKSVARRKEILKAVYKQNKIKNTDH